MSNLPVNKTEIIDKMAESADISKVAAGRALNAFFEVITGALRTGQSVSLLNFGTFMVKSRAARVGRNPKTGAAIQIMASNVPSFKAGKSLKDAVNSGSVVEEVSE